jgi:Phytanoyl-CoA dioxygenase (PhyH)
MHHAQSLWDIRQCPNLYHVFAEFFGDPRLMVDMNRCIFRPPIHPRRPEVSYSSIHWETDPRTKGPDSLQAVVLLTDVEPDRGGFQCLPEIYRNLNAWLEQYASADDFNFFEPGLNNRKTTQVAASAGDVIMWSTRLPHGTAANWSLWPRVASFVSMQPPHGDIATLRESAKAW